MSISATNLALLRQRTIARLQGEWAKSSDTFTPDQIDPFLSDAYREIQREAMLWKKVHSVSLTAGPTVTSYARPTDMLDRLTPSMHAARFIDADGNTAHVDERTWSYMREKYGELDNPHQRYGPADWSWDEADPEKFVVMYPPLQAGTFKLDYIVDPGDLSRVYDPDTADATVEVTNGSAAITFSGNITGLVAAGDAFGVKSGDDALPTIWYRIASIDSATEATLTENYAEATNAAAPFTCAEVSRLEYIRPALIRFAPVDYALAKLIAIEEGEDAAAGPMTAWQMAVNDIRTRAIPINQKPRGKDYYSRHPALRRF